jgi:hypothetical protein
LFIAPLKIYASEGKNYSTNDTSGAFGGSPSLLFGGSRLYRRQRGVVGVDPCAHAFRRFHSKARLLSQQDKGLGQAKVGRLLQLALQASGGLRRQAGQHLPGLRELVHALYKVPEGPYFLDNLCPVPWLGNDFAREEAKDHGFEIVAKYVTPELAYIVELDHTKARVGGRQDVAPFALRVTTIFRPEDGTWKVVHRHADPITTARPAESVLQQ